MPAQQTPATPTPAQPTQPVEPSVKKKNMGLIIAIIVLLVLLLGAIGWVVYLQFFKKTSEPVVQETTTTDDQTDEEDTSDEEEPVADNDDDEPADPYDGWETYTNSVHDYSLKYPADWTFNITTAEETDSTFGMATLIIEKDYYTFSLGIILGGIGGSVCKFDGDTCDPNAAYGCTEMGTSVDVDSELSGTYKRNKTGLSDVGQQVAFHICEGPGEYSRFVVIKGEASSVQYITPTNPDADMLETLDMIFSSIEEI